MLIAWYKAGQKSSTKQVLENGAYQVSLPTAWTMPNGEDSGPMYLAQVSNLCRLVPTALPSYTP